MAVRFTYETLPGRVGASGSLACFLVGAGAMAPDGKTLIDTDTPYVAYNAQQLDSLGDGSRSVGRSGTLRQALETIFAITPCPVVIMRMTSSLSKSPPTFTPATATGQVSGGQYTGITITGGGSGYVAAPEVQLEGGATGIATISAAGAVTGVQIVNPGTGISGSSATVTFVGGGATAADSPYAIKARELIERWSGIESEEYNSVAVGVKPRLLVDTGMVGDANSAIASSIAATMAAEAVHAGGIAVFGGGPTITSPAQFAIWYDGNAHPQTGRVLPLLIGSVTTGRGTEPPAAAIAGAIVKSVRDNGLVQNPEYQPVNGVVTYTPQFTYSALDDSPADAVAFPANQRNATIIIRRRGAVQTYGMVLATAENEDPLRYVSTRLIADILAEDMAAIAERYRGKPNSQRNIDKIAEELNEYLTFRTTQGVIRRGSYSELDREHATPVNIAAGDLEYDSVIRFYGVIDDIHLRTQATLRPAA